MYYNYNIQNRICWYWNYTRFQFNILYYNSILFLYILIPSGSVDAMGIDLFSPLGSVLPVFSVRGIELLVPRTALGGTDSQVTPARSWQW